MVWEKVAPAINMFIFGIYVNFLGGYGLGEAGNAKYSWYFERRFQLRQGWGDSVDSENQWLEDVIC